MLMPYLIGAGIGAGLTLLTIFTHFKVKEREGWEKEKLEMEAAYTCDKVASENVKLRVALAAAEQTEDGKTVATITMAALGNGIVGVEQIG